MSQHFFYPPNNGTVPGNITANQGTPNNDANAWPVRITDGTHDATVTVGGALNVAIASGLSNPLPVTDAAAEASLSSIDTKLTSQATAAKQDTGNASLASIDTKLTSPLSVLGPLTDTELRASAIDVLGPLTDAELRATPVPVSISSGISNPLPVQDSAAEASLASIDGNVIKADTDNVTIVSSTLPTGAATETTLGNTLTAVAEFSAKTAGSLVPEAFDYQEIAYVGASTDIDTVIYKTGGAAGSTVATLTMGYDGSGRLETVTRS